MTRKKNTNKLTFLVIPDAQSSVVRFRLSKWTLIAAAIVFILVVAMSAVLFVLRYDYLRAAVELKGQLAQSEETVVGQDHKISDLQNHVIDLSHQAEDFRAKLDQMKALEQSLKGLTGLVSPNGNGQSEIGGIAMDSASVEGASQAAAKEDPIAGRSGIGGSLNTVSSEEILQLSANTSKLLTDLDVQLAELKQSLAAVKQQAEEKKHELDMTPTIWPTESHQITSGFGIRIDPFTRYAAFHSGIDFAADMNSPVYATADGAISFTGYDSAHGNNVIINHSKGIQTRYLHLNKILVNDGDAVKKGQKIALSGNTGRSTGPHVHYEIIKNGVSIDPKPYLVQ
jgi:murein DD-endopeptidase MepM/ murein hydrolase activator NlpD